MSRFLLHAAGIDDEAVEHEARLIQGAGGGDEALGHGDPFQVPGAGGALVVGGHGVEHEAGVLAHGLGERDDHLAGDGIALLRHGGGGAAAFHERLEGFGDLGLHHQHDVDGDLGERAGDEAEEGDGLGHAVAGGVPGDGGLGEVQLAGEGGLHGEALVAERGERAGGAGELHDEEARLQLIEALAVPLDHGQPDGGLVAEGDGQGMLQVRAARHDRVAVAFGERGEGGVEVRRGRRRS